MRTLSTLALSLCLACTVPQAQAQAVPTLQSQLEAIIARHHGSVALFAQNLKTHETVAIAADTPVQTASVIKLTILYEALEQIRDGKVHFADKITLTAPDQVTGSGILRFYDTPLTLTFKDVLTMMIQMSDNTATNLAIDHLGLANINARIAKLHLDNTYLYKKVFTPTPPGTVFPADQKRFGLGKTTAREMASVLTRLVNCELAESGTPIRPDDLPLCASALQMLHHQFYRDAIPRYLDALPGATPDSIANKTGSLNSVRNDVAAVSAKSGMLILSVFTFDNADHSWGADDEGDLTLAQLARTILRAWSPEGLAPWPAPPSPAPPAH